MKTKNREIKGIFLLIGILFLLFLIYPVIRLFLKSFLGDSGITGEFYRTVWTEKGFLTALKNSFLVAGASGFITTVIAFFMAYAIHYTKLPGKLKGVIRGAAFLPMLLPTLTYGFAIIYSFGKQGLLTRIFGRQFFEIYGFNGLLLGYVIYTLPVAFMLICNTLGYIDKKFLVVSQIMGDRPFSTFIMTVFWPLLGTLGASFIQCFFLCFTDFGIPASVGGKYQVIASLLYEQMLGSVPDFHKGSVIAVTMLIPSVVSILLLRYLERFNVRYNKISVIEIRKNKVRDLFCGGLSLVFCLCIFFVFAVIFIVPFVENWPYDLGFSLEHIAGVFQDESLLGVYKNSIYVAALTAFFGTLLAYGGALVTSRSTVDPRLKRILDGLSLATNTIPGMVLGLAFLFCFSGTGLQGTFVILILCNMIHFFSTPYLMMKNSLSKMNASWETTAMLMGDNWFKTIARVVTPNAMPALLEVFSYYFVNAMVTVSAVVFLTGAGTMVITTKIKELQYYNKFTEVFALSLLMLLTNLAAKLLFSYFAKKRTRERTEEKKEWIGKKWKAAILAGLLILCGGFWIASGLSGGDEEKVVIYSNADEEAAEAMKAALDENGYKGQYVFQTFGTSELGGKLLAEGKNIEADLMTMSTFYLESAQEAQDMFQDLSFPYETLEEYPSYCAPVTAQEGTLIYNTELIREEGLDAPSSIKDLAKPEYKGKLAVTDISSSSTAWLLIQALLAEYGEEETREILSRIYDNAGDHIEDSGSAPLELVRAGEAAVGFGLRQQAKTEKQAGSPVDYRDPEEGNYVLTESLAVVDKGEKTKEKAMEMAECIVKNARKTLLEIYPFPLYQGEKTGQGEEPGNQKAFPEKLTAELLKEHQKLSEECKP